MMSKHHKRRKGARSFFYHRKQSSKKLSPLCLDPASLPLSWQLAMDGKQYYKLAEDPSDVGRLHVATSLNVLPNDGSWKAYFMSKPIPSSCKMLESVPRSIQQPSELAYLIALLDKATLCPGNVDKEFVAIYQAKGGVVKGERGNGPPVAFVENETIRRVNCEIICEGQYPCDACRSLRSTLRSARARHNQGSDEVRTHATSKCIAV